MRNKQDRHVSGAIPSSLLYTQLIQGIARLHADTRVTEGKVGEKTEGKVGEKSEGRL